MLRDYSIRAALLFNIETNRKRGTGISFQFNCSSQLLFGKAFHKHQPQSLTVLPINCLRHACSIIGDAQYTGVRAFIEKTHGNYAPGLIRKSIFESVGNQFVDDEPQCGSPS